ncbi:MAG: hypothetical protein V4671_13530 [Armatimonadota bacterium]
MSLIRRNNRLLLTLIVAWSIMLGAAHALHAVSHLTLAGTTGTDHACTLCAIDRESAIVPPGVMEAVTVPTPALLPLFPASFTGVSSPVHSCDALSPCSGRAPPFVSA